MTHLGLPVYWGQIICLDCQTLEYFHGNESIDACPINQAMRKLRQITYCTFCSNYVQSCPKQTICGSIGKMALTSFHVWLLMQPMVM